MSDRVRVAARALRWLPGIARSGPASRRSAADLFESRARAHPERTFVRFEGRSQSYGGANRAANRVAHWALARGLGVGDRVALLMENRPEYIETWVGLAKAGVTTALINTSLRGTGLAHALESAGPQVLIVGAECGEALASLPRAALAGCDVFVRSDPGRTPPALSPGAKSLDEATGDYSPRNPDRRVRRDLRGADDLFYIYTSGTTGLPKAARMSHARFMGGGLYALLAGFDAGDTLYCALPLYHTSGGVMAVNAVLRAGACLALRRRFSASAFWRDVVEMEASAFQYIGEFCRYLLQQPPNPWERRHRIRLAVGNGLRPDVWGPFVRRFGVARMVEFYGATEANVALVNLSGRIGSVGTPMPGTRVALVRHDVETEQPLRDGEGRCIPCAPGEVGELLGRVSTGRTAAGRFEGYTQAGESRKKLLSDVFAVGDCWFRSGDLLRRAEDGHYEFVDRVGDTFRWKGENVSTQETAESLSGCGDVALCCVYGVPVPGADGRAGMAALLLAPGAHFDPRAFYEAMSAALPSYARPAFVRLIADAEMTGTLKLRKGELQRQAYDPAACGGDPLWLRDDARGCFVPLEEGGLAKVRL